MTTEAYEIENRKIYLFGIKQFGEASKVLKSVLYHSKNK